MADLEFREKGGATHGAAATERPKAAQRRN